jgi:hypothetical protein
VLHEDYRCRFTYGLSNVSYIYLLKDRLFNVELYETVIISLFNGDHSTLYINAFSVKCETAV